MPPQLPTLLHLTKQEIARFLRELSPEALPYLLKFSFEEIRSRILENISSEYQKELLSEAEKITEKNMPEELNKLIETQLEKFIESEQIDLSSPIVKSAQTKKMGLDVLKSLAHLNSSQVKSLLKKIDSSDLAIILRYSAPERRDFILDNFTTKVAGFLKDDLETIGDQRENRIFMALENIKKKIQEITV